MRIIKGNKSSLKGGILGLLSLMMIMIAVFPTRTAAAQTSTVREGNDFATQVLRDPWDMNEFSDISQYLNTSGQSVNLQNIQVTNGIISAQSATSDPQFAALFPGYQTAMLIGKVGHNFPIQSSVYKCFYIAMVSAAPKPDYLQVFWFQDERLNGGVWGASKFTTINKEGWRLYKIDLSQAGGVSTPWNSSAAWQGLRVDPSNKSGVNFSIDWTRLTDCNPVNFSVPGLPANQTADIFLNKNGHDTWVGQVTSGNPVLDLQGVEAGAYTFNAKNASGALLSSGSVTINQAPIATFTRPSPSSGEDYAESSGSTWNMASSVGVSAVDCMTYSFAGGMLNLATPPNACPNGGGADPKIYLTSPRPASPGLYRYLNMKIYADGSWQDVPDGMITRLIWSIQGTGGSGSTCWLVSQDIPFDVGWNTYFIDLYDPFNSSVEERAGQCPANVTSWQNSGSIIGFRLDPNENILNRTLNQKIAWVRLTNTEDVARGSIFPVSIVLNKPSSAISTFNFYYTTTRSAPTQHPANGNLVSSTPPGPSPRGAHNFFLPAVTSGGLSQVVQDTTFNWNTSGVAPGQYYLCVSMNDGLNTGTYCSDAPVVVE